MNLVPLKRPQTITGDNALRRGATEGNILLVKPPYFSPWTPPLGIAILKSFLAQQGYSVRCYDFNTDPDLWGMHHKYFGALQTLEDVSINDGYSKLWWILNAHMLAVANGATPAQCSALLEAVIPLYQIRISRNVINTLTPLVEKFYERLGTLADELDLSEYSFVGTSTYTTSLGPSLFFLKKIKQKYPQIKTVMGGGVFADDLASGSDNLETLIRDYDFVDHIILGEGEMLLLKLIQGELAHKRVISLSDLNRVTLEMKDVPVPDFSDVDLENYYHLSIEGARSCPFQCSFCSETIQWGDYRKKPAELFARQVAELADRYNNRSFFMGDSLMNPYINPFATELLERDVNILYDGYLRADKPVTNRKFVKLWADSGCYRVRLGIESASARVLDAMDKMTTPKIISDALKTLANAGIRTTTYWIVGFPGETEEDFQETCEFIKEHHRYIYEFEAHPYYYYPYGQIGSRLYQSYSLYPEEVTNITKFKAWEIVESEPAREERYDRLRRISKLASDLGLPNIYTMAERFDAERRWHRLYPLAVEVYKGTRLERSKPSLPSEPMIALCGQWIGEPGQAIDRTLCYHTSVAASLDEGLLSESLAHLIEYNEMLQLRFEEGRYTHAPQDDEWRAEKMLYVYPDYCDENGTRLSQREIIRQLSEQMIPEPGRCLRLALVTGETSELFLLVHRCITDAKTTTLFMEELLRIYEQLSNGREICLLRARKTYAELIGELESNDSLKSAFARPRSEFQTRQMFDTKEFKVSAVALNEDVAERLFSRKLTDLGLMPANLMTFALLGCLEKSSLDHPLKIDVINDYRSSDLNLEQTPGALTYIHRLSSSLYAESLTPAIREIRHALSVSRGSEGEPNQDEATILFDFEYLIAPPWMGGDLWNPRGFIVSESMSAQTYLLKITPQMADGSLTVKLYYHADFSEPAQIIEANLGEELIRILHRCECYFAAKEFWLKEFGKEPPVSNIEMICASADEQQAGWAVSECDVPASVIEQAGLTCNVDLPAAILSAFGVLLSRLNGREDLIVLASLDEPEAVEVVPVRLNPAWELSFGDFARQVERALSLSTQHGTDAFEILSNETGDSTRSAAASPYDVAFVFRRSGDQGEKTIAEIQSRHHSIAGGLALTLQAVQVNGSVSAQFVYQGGRFEPGVIEKLSSYFKSILQQAAANEKVLLADIELERHFQSSNAADVLAKDSFSFGQGL
jgi:radical SAM superfamily enzyme YgiQ (UPF0313 family)